MLPTIALEKKRNGSNAASTDPGNCSFVWETLHNFHIPTKMAKQIVRK